MPGHPKVVEKNILNLCKLGKMVSSVFGGSESVVRMLHVFQRRHLKKKINS